MWVLNEKYVVSSSMEKCSRVSVRGGEMGSGADTRGKICVKKRGNFGVCV